MFLYFLHIIIVNMIKNLYIPFRVSIKINWTSNIIPIRVFKILFYLTVLASSLNSMKRKGGRKTVSRYTYFVNFFLFQRKVCFCGVCIKNIRKRTFKKFECLAIVDAAVIWKREKDFRNHDEGILPRKKVTVYTQSIEKE